MIYYNHGEGGGGGLESCYSLVFARLIKIHAFTCYIELNTQIVCIK